MMILRASFILLHIVHVVHMVTDVQQFRDVSHRVSLTVASGREKSIPTFVFAQIGQRYQHGGQRQN